MNISNHNQSTKVLMMPPASKAATCVLLTLQPSTVPSTCNVTPSREATARNSRVPLILPREQQALHAGVVKAARGVVKAARGQAHTYTEMPRTCELASRAREPVTRRSHRAAEGSCQSNFMVERSVCEP